MSKSSKKKSPEDSKAGAKTSGKGTGKVSGTSQDDDRSRPSIDVRAIAMGELEIEPFPAVEHGFRVFISEDAFDRAVERGQKDTSREIGGVLVGVVRRDDAGPYVRVDTTIDALHAEEKGAELTFTHDTWQHIHEQMDTVHQGKRLVGWYHTHPGFGIFLSDRDQFIHHSFFDLPFQVAMVYDPKSREHGVFTWREGNLERSRRYWIGAHEHTWDGPRHAPAEDDDDADGSKDVDRGTRTRVDSASRDPDRESPGFDWFAIGLIGLILLLGAGWGGHCVGQWRIRDQATVAIAQAQAVGAQQSMQMLNAELLDTVRGAMDKDSVRAHVDDIVTELDRALDALDSKQSKNSKNTPDTGQGQAADGDAGDPDTQPGTEPAAGQGAKVAAPDPETDSADKARYRIKRARRAALDLLAEQKNLAVIIDTFRRSARGGGSAEARALVVHQSALSTLYSELARDLARQGDKQRAIRYLKTAALIDPGGIERYQKQLNELDKNAKLAIPRGQERAPAPAPDTEKNRDKGPE